MGIKFPTPWKTLIIKFPPPRDGKGVKCPGYARGGGGHVEASIWPIHNLALLRLVRREAEVKTTRLRFKPSSLAVCTFPRCLSKYIQLKIRSTKNTNESRLFSGSRHSGVKRKIKQSVVKWIGPKCAFKIINFHLSYPLYLFLFIIHLCVSLFYYFFYPRLLNVRTCVPCVQVATPLPSSDFTNGHKP